MFRPQSYFRKPNIAVLCFAQARCRVDKEIPGVRHHLWSFFPWDVAKPPGSEAV